MSDTGKVLEAIGRLSATTEHLADEVKRTRELCDFVQTSVETQEIRLRAFIEENKDVAKEIRELREGFREQEARVKSFLEHGKGAEWDRDIQNNKAAVEKLVAAVARLETNDIHLMETKEAIEGLTLKLHELETNHKVSKAKILAALGAVGVTGGGVAEVLHNLLG